jgi:hypothetical protein
MTKVQEGAHCCTSVPNEPRTAEIGSAADAQGP